MKDLGIDELLTDAEVQELLKMSRTTLWRLRKRGLPHLKIGGRYRYRKSELLRWMQLQADSNETQLSLSLRDGRPP